MVAAALASEATWIRDGGRLPFSPLAFVDPDFYSAHHRDPHSNSNSNNRRNLGSNDESSTSYLVDEDGNEYEPYSLAWRYLGMYMDCDLEDDDANEDDDDNDDDGEERRLSQDDGGDCERVLLWAAVSNIITHSFLIQCDTHTTSQSHTFLVSLLCVP